MDAILAPTCKQNQFLQFKSSVKNGPASKSSPSELIVIMRSVRKGGGKGLKAGQQRRHIRCRYIIRSVRRPLGRFQRQESAAIRPFKQTMSFPQRYYPPEVSPALRRRTLKTNSCLFQTYNNLLFIINIKFMTFTRFRPKKAHGNENEAQNDGPISADNSICRAAPVFLPQQPISGLLQQKQTELSAKKRSDAAISGRKVRLEGRGSPSAEKMRRISERRGCYKRSTNNSHKKFICVAKRLLVRLLEGGQREAFENAFEEFKNSRTYYFIVLAHAKLLLPPASVAAFRQQFVALMLAKVDLYRKEVARTDNRNFINFRSDEIADIEFALIALDLYFQDHVEQAIETIYKRDRVEVLKKQQFELAVQAVREVEARLKEQSHPHSQRQEVIILQHNALPAERLKQEERPAIVKSTQLAQIDSPLFPPGFHPTGCFTRTDRPQQVEGAEKTMPLLFLEDSYPFFEYFYEIMFPYEGQIRDFKVNPADYLQSCWGFELEPRTGCEPIHQELAEKGRMEAEVGEQGKRGSLFVGKTAVEEEEEGRMCE